MRSNPSQRGCRALRTGSVHFRAHIEDYRRFIESGRRFYVVLPIGYIAPQAVAGRLVLQTRGTDEFRYFEGNAEASR